ncbi:hypothetical protein QUB70_24580 [Microcoleus sp. A003_D6]
MICWPAILICDRFSEQEWARSIVCRARSRSKAVRANPMIFETGISQDVVEVDRVKKDCSTNASIEGSLFSLIHLLLGKPALEAFCE